MGLWGFIRAQSSRTSASTEDDEGSTSGSAFMALGSGRGWKKEDGRRARAAGEQFIDDVI